ncbi:hypothetical protein GE061_013015 [Apolygus lucorum]|uniref:Uncharacterized protein n=1 Tax=Apolygus lucorum TaxID=248454 RepID=A0A8S9XTZ0_APOLU|nr:hypothetical protein GE061_013015 [Apolygus lucorum]
MFSLLRDTPASIGYKYNYEEDDFRRIPLGTASVRRSRPSTSKMTEALPPLYHKQLPISEAKKRDLITLCRKNVIPKNLQQWFHDLPTIQNGSSSTLGSELEEYKTSSYELTRFVVITVVRVKKQDRFQDGGRNPRVYGV